MTTHLAIRTRSRRVPATPRSSRAPRAACPVEPLEPRTLFAATTNDPSFGSQFNLASASVADAWSTTRGSAAVVVAHIDTGADYAHPDLYKNVWINQAEIPSSVKSRLRDADADGRITFYDLNHSLNRALLSDVNRNGYIDGSDLLSPTSQGGWEDRVNGRSNANDRYTDDIIGWDFAENDNDPFDDGSTNRGHGTHTAGILGAVGNNGRGISGVAQRTSMMIVRIFTDGGSGASDARIAESIRYTADSGARVANASWGGDDGYNGDTTYAAIQYAGSKGELFVAAAGNAGRNLDSSSYGFFPAEYNLANVVTVAATTASGGLASFSNYGAAQADVAAVGSGVYSTLPGNKYGTISGTSMAAPLVSGTAALMLSANRSLTAAQLKQRLIAGSDESTALKDRSVSDGKLNAYNAVLNRSGINLPAPAQRVASTASVASSGLAPSLASRSFATYFFDAESA